MIHPHLATMLAVVTTDYRLDSGEARGFLKPAIAEMFNSISVDGECSTNDAVIWLASGARGIRRTLTADASFAQALREVCADLAEQIVTDAHRTATLIEIEVTGAATGGDAKAIARRIAFSPLVKTAQVGGDRNWGPILAAAGSMFIDSGFARPIPDRVTLAIDGKTVFAAGAPTDITPVLPGSVYRICLDLALGSASAKCLASDLSRDCVRIDGEHGT